MKFVVERASTSCMLEDENTWRKPCEEAYIDNSPKIGKSDYNLWCIDLNTLDDVLNFMEKYGNIVIRRKDASVSAYQIEIYDDWIE